jgi:uncharacterized membrane protein YqaE (UPF0057 family)
MAKKQQQSKLQPKRHHGFAVLLFILGTIFPPLAVAARFGIGKDFWLNLFLTICGYIPGHMHNFYVQNIRNNKNHARTPKWAQRYGLVDTSEIKRKERKSQWASRYNDRLPQSTLENQEYEEGQDHGSSVDISTEGQGGKRQQKGDRQPNGDLWRPEDETFYGAEGEASSIRTGTSSGGGRWHYPANFDDAAPPKKSVKKKDKKDKKDRWARTEDAHSISEEQSGKKKKKKKSRSSTHSDSTTEFPEDAAGGLYGERGEPPGQTEVQARVTEDVFDHQF